MHRPRAWLQQTGSRGCWEGASHSQAHGAACVPRGLLGREQGGPMTRTGRPWGTLPSPAFDSSCPLRWPTGWAPWKESKHPAPVPRPRHGAQSPAGQGEEGGSIDPPTKGAARTRPLSAPTQGLTSDPPAPTLPLVDWTLASDHVNPGQSQLKQTLPPDLGFARAAQQAPAQGPQVPSLDCCCPHCCPRCCPWSATVGELAP